MLATLLAALRLRGRTARVILLGIYGAFALFIEAKWFEELPCRCDMIPGLTRRQTN